MPVPAIAIHGSQPAREIARAVDGTFQNSPTYDRVVTLAFDWDRMVPPVSSRGVRNLGRFLRRHASNISAASRIGLEFGAHTLDGSLGGVQRRLHWFLQWVVAALVATLFASWLAEVVVLPFVAWYGLPTAAFAPMQWMTTAIDWLQLGVGGGVTLLILLGGLRLLVTMSPRPPIVTFRSVVLLLAQPLLIILLGGFAAHWTLLWAVFGLLGLVAFLDSGTGGLVLWALLLAVLIGLRMLWARGSLGGPIKIVLDGFRYLGEPGYRSRIQQALDKAIVQARQRTGEDEDFVLMAQGLGTVMALDCIMHSQQWKRTDRILLVTMGSPLRRYFLRLYPRTLFPEFMEDVIDLIAGRLEEFRWINVYRPGDYLGADLGLKPFKGRDLTTGERGPGIIGHADYWRGMDARRAIADGLQLLGPIEPLRVPMKDAAHRIPRPQSAAAGLEISPFANSTLWLTLMVATFAWGLWWVATGSGVFVMHLSQPPDLLDQFGVTVNATATHRRQALHGDDGIRYINHWEFQFAEPSGAAKRLHVQRDASDAFHEAVPLYFDDRAFTRHLRAECKDQSQFPEWWPNQQLETACTVDGVRVRYYPGDESLLELPDFPRERFPSDPVQAWTEAGVAAAVLATLILVPVVLGIRLFVVILG